MATVKHFEWVDTVTGDEGRVALLVDGDYVSLYSLSSEQHPMEVLFEIFYDNRDLCTRANACEFERQKPFHVAAVMNDDGNTEIRLRTLRAAVLRDAPVAARLCLVEGRLQDFSRIWLGDFPPLLVAAMGAVLRDDTICVTEVEIFDGEGNWSAPRSKLLDGRRESLSSFETTKPWLLSESLMLDLPKGFWQEQTDKKLPPVLEDLRDYYSQNTPSWEELLERLRGVKDP